MELLGRTALVTGAGRRVGRAIALALADRGMDIVVHYKGSAPEARATAEAVECLGRRAVTIQADLAQPEEVEALVDRAVQTFGTIDVLVNSAALFHRTPLEKVTGQDWDQFLRSEERRVGKECRL